MFIIFIVQSLKPTVYFYSVELLYNFAGQRLRVDWNLPLFVLICPLSRDVSFGVEGIHS